jgi:group I intron endonuclease
LKNGKHPNQHLQHAYNLYGVDAFVFEILEECDDGIVIEREQFWIDSLWDSQTLYNVARIAGASFKGRKHKKSTITKMKNWHKTHVNPMILCGGHNESAKRRIRATCTEKFKHRRRLTEEQIKEVYQLHLSGLGKKKIGERYGVSKPTIQRILRGTRYRTVSKI